MTTYIHELLEWPRFTWDQKALAEELAAVRNQQGRLTGRMEAFGFKLRAEADLESLTEEVIKSSEIEGEVLDTRPGALVDRAPSRHRYRRADSCRTKR